jgi:hypothetical protein
MDKTFIAYFKDLSPNGACIKLEDRYNRFDVIKLKDSWIELIIDMPQGEKVSLNARICWIRNDNRQKSFSVLIGLEYNEIKETQLEQIKK